MHELKFKKQSERLQINISCLPSLSLSLLLYCSEFIDPHCLFFWFSFTHLISFRFISFNLSAGMCLCQSCWFGGLTLLLITILFLCFSVCVSPHFFVISNLNINSVEKTLEFFFVVNFFLSLVETDFLSNFKQSWAAIQFYSQRKMSFSKISTKNVYFSRLTVKLYFKLSVIYFDSLFSSSWN